MGSLQNEKRAVATPEQILSTPPAAETPPAAIATEITPPTPAPKPDSVDADLAEAKRAAEALKKPKTPEFEVRFVKNVNPHEKITFKDGTTFRFPGALYRCKDPEQADKITAVADQFGIVLQ